MAYYRSVQQLEIIHCINSVKQHKSTNNDIYLHIKQNFIRNIALKIGKDISENYYGKFSTIDKNAKFLYYLVKWTSESYNFQSSHKIVKYVIRASELVCDAVYLNSLANFSQ